MSRSSTITKLAKVVRKMRAEREDYAARVAQIDEFFSELGIGTEGGEVVRRKPGRPAGRRGRKPGRRGRKPGLVLVARRGRRRGRGSFAVTGEESVTNFIKSHGHPTASEVNAHWRKEGRGGKADNALSKLVKTGVLKRQATKSGERGGRYVIA